MIDKTITIKMDGPQGVGKSILARKIYEVAKTLGLKIEVFSGNDGEHYVKEDPA